MILCPWGFPGKSTGVACHFLLHLWLSNASIVMVVGLHAINPARGASSVVRNLPAKCRRRGFNPLLWKIPWRRKGQPTPVLLPEKIPGWRILLGYCPWGHKELDITERLRTHTHTHTMFHCMHIPLLSGRTKVFLENIDFSRVQVVWAVVFAKQNTWFLTHMTNLGKYIL